MAKLTKAKKRLLQKLIKQNVFFEDAAAFKVVASANLMSLLISRYVWV
jgi:hypothetical protein